MSQHIGQDGVPLRHDGTPFPADSSQWTEAEKEYLETYYFGTREHVESDGHTVAAVEVPEIHDGSAIA